MDPGPTFEASRIRSSYLYSANDFWGLYVDLFNCFFTDLLIFYCFSTSLERTLSSSASSKSSALDWLVYADYSSISRTDVLPIITDNNCKYILTLNLLFFLDPFFFGMFIFRYKLQKVRSSFFNIFVLSYN